MVRLLSRCSRDRDLEQQLHSCQGQDLLSKERAHQVNNSVCSRGRKLSLNIKRPGCVDDNLVHLTSSLKMSGHLSTLTHMNSCCEEGKLSIYILLDFAHHG